MSHRALLLLLIKLASTWADPPVYDGQIRDEGDGLSAAYMVPYSVDNHAVTIEALPDGSLVAAWFGGEHEKSSGVAIVVSRLANGSQIWTNRSIVAQRDGYANGNPLLFYDSITGMLHLWHTQVKANAGEGEAEIYHWNSRDGGASWSDQGRYFQGQGIYIRNRIIRRKDGTLLWPFYSTGWSASATNGRSAAFAYSKNTSVPVNGDTGWTKYVLDAGGARLEQPTCWRQPHNQSTIMCYIRSEDGKHIYETDSTDEGKSFSKPQPTKLPNPNSGIEGFPLLSRNLVLLFNPTQITPVSRGRNPLAAGISSDDGKTWKQRDVQNGPTGMPSLGEDQFSYPSVLQTSDGTIHAMYTYAPAHQRRTIKYIRFTEGWVTGQLAS